MNTRDNIGYVVSRFPKTTETFIAREANGLRLRGHSVSVLALRRETGQIVQPEAEALMDDFTATSDATAAALAAAQARWLLRSPRRWARIWARTIVGNIKSPHHLARSLVVALGTPWAADQVRHQQLHHLHAHWGTHSALLAYLVSILTDVPYSVTLHAHDLYIHQVMLGEKLDNAETVVTISDHNRRIIERLFPNVTDRIEVVHCGVDVDVVTPPAAVPDNPAPKIVTVAGLREYKGLSYLIAAHETLHRRGYDVDLEIIGDGPLRQNLEYLANTSRGGNRITFSGAQPADQALSSVAGADVFVLPSVVMANGRKDGIPVALMEAMAQAIPVVSTRVSGIPELVEHEVTGLLVDQRHATGLADAIERIITDRPLRDRLASAGRQRVVEQFNLTRTVDAMERIVAYGGHPARLDTASPVEVAMIIQNYLPTVGGAERQLHSLNPLFLEQQVTPTVYTRSRPGQPATETLNGARVVRVPCLGPPPVQAAMFVLGTLARLLRTRPDVVHAYDTLTPSLIAAFHRLATGTPFLTKLLRSGHLGDLNRLAGRQLGAARLQLLKRSADRFVAISGDLQDELSRWGVDGDRQVFIPNGVDTDRFRPPPLLETADAADTKRRWAQRRRIFEQWPDAPVAVVVGRVSAEKRVIELAAAWQRVVEHQPDAWLYVVGEGPLADQLVGFGNVAFLGRREDVAEILRWSDLYISASSAEGLSNALLEAMASGCTCVVTDVGGVGDVVTNGADGLIVAAEGTDRSTGEVVNDIAEQVIKLIEDPVGRVRLSRAARRRVVEDYSLAATANALVDQYRRLGRQPRSATLWSNRS